MRSCRQTAQSFLTNAIIYSLDQDPAVIAVIEPILAQDMALFVSVVTELELLSYGSLTEEDMAEIAHLLTSMVVFPLESRLAHLAALLLRQYRLKTPDSVVAATALLTRTALVTRNVQDFQGIAGLSPPHLKPAISPQRQAAAASHAAWCDIVSPRLAGS